MCLGVLAIVKDALMGAVVQDSSMLDGIFSSVYKDRYVVFSLLQEGGDTNIR